MTTEAKANKTKTAKPKVKKKKDGTPDKRAEAGAKRSGENSPMYSRTKESGGLLTPRQTEILRLVTLGCSTREIALLLGISPSTADNHKSAMMQVIGCNKATLLVRVAIEMKVTKADETLTKAEIAKLGGDFIDGWNRRR